jgi:hypothetical protein
MSKSLRIISVSLALIVNALLGMGCAQPQLLAAGKTEPVQLEARGPGTVFASIETAALDALTYAYLQARAASFRGSTELMRGGTIYATPGGYSYGEIHVASPRSVHRIWYTLKPQDVARFHVYPRHTSFRINRFNERPTREDRRSVSVIDPLHRPIYFLHPSLMIREYRGEDHGLREVANLQHPTRTQIFAKRREELQFGIASNQPEATPGSPTPLLR